MIFGRAVFRRTHHADGDDRGKPGDCSTGFPSGTLAPWRQRTRRPGVSGGAALFYRLQHHLARPSGGFRPLEFDLETLLAAEPSRHLRGLFFDALAALGSSNPILLRAAITMERRAPDSQVQACGREGLRIGSEAERACTQLLKN